MWNLPNSLTVFRILLVPLLVVVLLTRFSGSEFWGLGIFLLAALTDLFDGIIARRTGSVTVVGTLLDPIADKLLISAAFISLVELGLAPAWMVVIILGREIAVQGLRIIATAEGFTVAVSDLGKLKMVLQVCAAAILIPSSAYPQLHPWGTLALWLVMLSALVSAVRYFAEFWRNLDDRIKQRRAKLLIVHSSKKQDAAAQ